MKPFSFFLKEGVKLKLIRGKDMDVLKIKDKVKKTKDANS